MGSIYFFKIVLDDAIRDGKLEIPRPFIRKHGKNLPNTMFLEVPTGAKWQVSLTKQDDRVWLQNGWPQFAHFYSIRHGHFLVFSYDGTSTFHVTIFDTLCAEIDYPKRRGRRSIVWATRGQRSEVPKRSNQATSSANQVPSFTMTMRAAYIETRYLCIPIEFATEYKFEEHENIILRGPDGTDWPAKCRYNSYGELKYPKLYGGWFDFVKGYKIQVGDVCEFMLVDVNAFTLHVDIRKGH